MPIEAQVISNGGDVIQHTTRGEHVDEFEFVTLPQVGEELSIHDGAVGINIWRVTKVVHFGATPSQTPKWGPKVRIHVDHLKWIDCTKTAG